MIRKGRGINRAEPSGDLVMVKRLKQAINLQSPAAGIQKGPLLPRSQQLFEFRQYVGMAVSHGIHPAGHGIFSAF
jgi:hypothetical protein